MNVFQPYALLLARMLLSGVFLLSAISKLHRDPQDLKAVAGLHVPYPGLMLLIVGICEIIGVVMLTLGAGARIAAVLLSLFIIFVTLAFLRFWTVSASDARFAIKNAFFGNLGVIGGLIYVAVFGPGSLAILDGL